jgi:hypothetical protein
MQECIWCENTEEDTFDWYENRLVVFFVILLRRKLMDTPLNNEKPSLGDVKQKEAEYVAVAILDDMAQARDYQQLLEESDIPVHLLEDDEQEGVGCVVVMVPEESIDEAQVVIESQDAYDDFYDLALDEDIVDFDDMLDDEY